MKKLVTLLSFSAFFFVGCNAGAKAGTATIDAGNPDSNNVMVIEEDYQAIVTAPVMANQPAPAPQVQNPPAASNNATVLESVTETSTPDSSDIEAQGVIIPDNQN